VRGGETAMKTLRRSQLALGVTVFCAMAVLRGATQSLEARASFTAQVTNYAGVKTKELAEAEQVAAAIFRRAGVRSSWADVRNAENSAFGDQPEAGPCVIYVHIQSSAVADKSGLSNKVMGMAPGSGPDRQLVYVFYDRVKPLAQRQLTAAIRGDLVVPAAQGHILGAIIAHEIGHVLLNMPSHSETGIMRGPWDLRDLRDVAYGAMYFTAPQAMIIKAEVIRRTELTQVVEKRATR
jgi:hypothetical protein